MVVLVLTCAPSIASAVSGLPVGTRPIPGSVITEFDPPDVNWDAGHRGLDLAGKPGETVVAAAGGTVTFAGVLAGRGVVVVDHGMVRTTYEPVAATITVGNGVVRGEPIGRLQAGHASCPGRTCLHWGLREGETYLDPLLLLGSTIRLLPASATPAQKRSTTSEQISTAGSLSMPASGPVTSPFGMRRHPVTGVWKLHDGTDFGAPCRSPIRASAAGTVISVTSSSAYGNRLIIDHGTGPDGHLVTSYNHAQSYVVAAGDHVSAGQEIGSIGSTGLSTGCHLHFQVWKGGNLVDPMSVLS